MVVACNGRLAAAACALGLVAGVVLFPTAASASGKSVTGGNSANSGASAAATHSKGNAGTSGVYNQAQPFSRADMNNTGANTTSPTNPYRSTRNGAPSLNGSGNGNATGRPCAGCVGKADNKNPHGQQPNGTDHNAGYECDRNQGIGRTNPAHTGCVSGSTSPPTTSPHSPPTTRPNGPPTTPPGSPPTTRPGSPPTTHPGGPATLTPGLTPPPPPHLSALVETLPPASAPGATSPVAGLGPAAASSGRLAFTGSDLIGEAAAGLAALGVGGLGVRVARRRSR